MAEINATSIALVCSCRGVLLTGAHGPVTIFAQPLSQHSLEYYYGLTVDHPGQVGAEVRYRGHRDDLLAARCIGSQYPRDCGSWSTIPARFERSRKRTR
jgi:hypothetical protein